MSKCKYCGEDAGFLKSSHSECETKHSNATNRLAELLLATFCTYKDFYLIDRDVKSIISGAFITNEQLNKLYVDSFDKAIDIYLEDGLISEEESRTVARFQQYTNLPQQILNTNKSLERVVQAGILKEIVAGIIPTPPITVQGNLPFLFQKNERLLWVFRDVQYYQQKIRREMRGRSHGMSFRVMKGVYYRVGGFKGTPIETTHSEYIDTGIVGVTNKHIYFSSQKKSFKIPYNKIVDLQSFSDGLGIQKDGASSQPLFLKGVSSWFLYNLITNITQL